MHQPPDGQTIHVSQSISKICAAWRRTPPRDMRRAGLKAFVQRTTTSGSPSPKTLHRSANVAGRSFHLLAQDRQSPSGNLLHVILPQDAIGKELSSQAAT